MGNSLMLSASAIEVQRVWYYVSCNTYVCNTTQHDFVKVCTITTIQKPIDMQNAILTGLRPKQLSTNAMEWIYYDLNFQLGLLKAEISLVHNQVNMQLPDWHQYS